MSGNVRPSSRRPVSNRGSGASSGSTPANCMPRTFRIAISSATRTGLPHGSATHFGTARGRVVEQPRSTPSSMMNGRRLGPVHSRASRTSTPFATRCETPGTDGSPGATLTVDHSAQYSARERDEPP
jgi:hypothetical protein